PNLVALYELLVAEGHWVFTMELVEGTNLLWFLRPDLVGGEQRDTMLAAGAPPPRNAGAPTATARPTDVVTRGSAEQCRATFRRPAGALHFLPESGKPHRDLKPSNILTPSEGRVVVLDFGLVTALGDSHTPVPTSYVMGTPGYVAPEVLAQDVAGPAADWYSVG